ncbi:DEAD/DEAH box helicase family protein [Rubrobacter indicoceani]|uniref:restriction endonuclease n=1 Tax=Rubrobacter indicoceani TaxID=2051957 RepID=UPI000E5B5F09|nr:DEAD/DEAH box helicase family protein [Rubrobacter indicoceani]
MKIQFDGQQQYQLDAVNSILDLFDGQPLARGQFEVGLSAGTGELMGELGFGNRLSVPEEKVLENLRAVQGRNGIVRSKTLESLDFTTEMETGTGKTYVYLRTIHELHARYGFNKFVIAVPSVAIREGVKTSIELMRDHFRKLFGAEPMDYQVYDSKRVSGLRQFATSNELQILIINIDAFNKKASNVIHREDDRLSGHKPVDFIRATNPVVIMDEPQNMESGPAREAIASLNPLCTLRYSATHRNLYNPVYRLSPVDAYDMKLVKRIEVASVMDEADFNRPYISVDGINRTKSKITAKLTIDARDTKKGSVPKRKTVTVGGSGDLYTLSGERDIYEGYRIDSIDYGSGYISFTNGEVVYEGETVGDNRDDRMRVQVFETVREHLDKELRIHRTLPPEKRLKVLSLFFIDRVANYTGEDGKIRTWFIESYEELSKRPHYAVLEPLPVEQVHDGYFAEDKKGNAKETREKTKNEQDNEAYRLIMKDKERLLSTDEPLRFIFSHSALREGWDNPNVFQICTLNESKSETRKRQEIGRGLRLPVDASGERSFDPVMNRLTVVANESYAEFASALQTEIEEETGVTFEGRIVNRRERKKAHLKDGWRQNEDFVKLWEKIKSKTRYSVAYDTEELIAKAADALRDMPPVSPPKIATEKRSVDITERGVGTSLLSFREESAFYDTARIPDLLGYIQQETELTRTTISKILIESTRLADARTNPQAFMDAAARSIRKTLDDLTVTDIKYEKLTGGSSEYDLFEFEEREIEGYRERMLDVKKSIYDAIEYDSETEKRFAHDLDTLEDVKLFVKLPSWFKIATPAGGYNPDWAVVKQKGGKEKLYLVRETKSDLDENRRRPEENVKINCGAAHFHELDVDYAVATDAREL